MTDKLHSRFRCKLKFVCLCSLIALLAACTDKTNLGHNYCFLPEYEAIDVGYPLGAIIYKSKYKYRFSKIIVSNKVLDVNYNQEHIIVLQKRCDIETSIENPSEFTERKCSDTLAYYIIEKKTDSLYGPFNKNMFVKYKNLLKVGDRLEFDLP